jgi:hypothetical protein
LNVLNFMSDEGNDLLDESVLPHQWSDRFHNAPPFYPDVR